MEIKGPKGAAYVYQGAGHDWIVDFYAKGTRKRDGRHVLRTISNSNKTAAIIIAKQLAGAFDKTPASTKKAR